MKIKLFHLAFATLLAGTTPAYGQDEMFLGNAERGEEIYVKECAVCHGEKGDGDGRAAYLLFPKPRNFTSGVFKIRSTPTGNPPTAEDLFRTVSRGMAGSAMPGFEYLPSQNRKDLVAFVMKLADFAEAPDSVYKVTRPSPYPPRMATMGKDMYDLFQCGECHGATGRADGPASASLMDDDGFPIRANDFTRGIFKGGGDPEDIYLRFVTGMDGTPMPSYEYSLDEEERWVLVDYVKSLSRGLVKEQPKGGTLIARRISGEIEIDPLSTQWNSANAVDIPLMLLWQRPESVQMLSVRSLHNGKQIGIKLEWEDLTVNANVIANTSFADGAALQFDLSGGSPSFTMGDENKPVNIWLWRFDKQLDMLSYRDVENEYASMAVDVYPFERQHYPFMRTSKDQLKPENAVTPTLVQDPTFLAGWGGDNYLSDPRKETPIEDMNAEGFGTIEPQPKQNQNVQGKGVWKDGKWHVCFARDLSSTDSEDIQFRRIGQIYIAFAIWDGEAGDRDGQKSVTNWLQLELK
ncbi:MAG: ethylbenzene dehydrogenase-related protein [Bacteroidota bacterium]